MCRRARCVPFVAAVSLLAASITAQPESPARPRNVGYAADEVVGLDAFPGSKAARSALLELGFVVVDAPIVQLGEKRPMRQLFSAYIGVRNASFITTDLVLDAYTRLLTDVVLAIDRRQVAKLAEYSRLLHEAALDLHTERGAELAALAEVALALQGGDARAVGDRAQRMQLALEQREAALLPGLEPIFAQWLRPVGEYGGDPQLARYFRARRFLQSCRVRLGHPTGEELARALAACFGDCARLREVYAELQDPWVELVGPLEAPGPAAAGGGTRCLLPPVRSPLHDLQELARERAMALPPTGLLMLAAGPLSSRAGERIWRATFGALPELANVGAPDSQYGRFLQALAGLQEPDPRAPEMFRSEAWADKQAFTQLGAWATARHALVLPLWPAIVLGGISCPPPIVSPYPEVFRAVADRADELRALHERAAVGTPDLEAMQAEIRWVLAEDGEEEIYPERVARCESGQGVLFDLFPSQQWDEIRRRAARACADAPERLRAEDRALLEGFARGGVDGKLRRLARVCRRLAELARRQLEEEPPAEDDVRFLEGVGESIAAVHGYRYGGGQLSPRDDHPRIAPVGRILGTPAILHVGVARPESLYVILPRDGRPTLHLGAVLGYRETVRAEPLTNAAWRAEVREGSAPEPPRFTRSFRRE